MSAGNSLQILERLNRELKQILGTELSAIQVMRIYLVLRGRTS